VAALMVDHCAVAVVAIAMIKANVFIFKLLREKPNDPRKPLTPSLSKPWHLSYSSHSFSSLTLRHWRRSDLAESQR